MNGSTPEIRDIRRSPYGRALLADPCPYCGGPSEVIDHIHALTRGGDDDASNFVGACALCNKRKGPRSLLAFLLGLRVADEDPPANLGDELVRLLGLERATNEWRAATRRAMP